MKPYQSEFLPPRVGDPVIYIDLVRNIRRHALVSVVFTERDRPHLTLAMVKPGGGIVFKPHVPHQSASMGSDCYWQDDPRTSPRLRGSIPERLPLPGQSPDIPK